MIGFTESQCPTTDILDVCEALSYVELQLSSYGWRIQHWFFPSTFKFQSRYWYFPAFCSSAVISFHIPDTKDVPCLGTTNIFLGKYKYCKNCHQLRITRSRLVVVFKLLALGEVIRIYCLICKDLPDSETTPILSFGRLCKLVNYYPCEKDTSEGAYPGGHQNIIVLSPLNSFILFPHVNSPF